MKKWISALFLGALCTTSWAQEAGRPDPAQLFQWTTDQKLYGFSHTADLYANEPFHAGKGSALIKDVPVKVNYQYGGTTRSVDDYVVSQKAAGLLVLKKGKVALEWYAPGINETTLWESKSVGKSVVSTLMGAALKEGKIKSLDDKVELYIPELKGSAYEGVTLRNMIRMASGVAWVEDPYEDPSTDANHILAAGLASGKAGNMLQYMKGLKRAVDKDGKPVEQGTVWNYNTGEAFLSGLVVQRATGKTLSKYLEEKIWKPAQMEHDGLWILESKGGVSFGGIGFNATLRDYGRFAQFVLGNGVLPNGTSALPARWVQDATTWFGPSALPDFADNGQYGYMWWFSPAFDDEVNQAAPLTTKTGPVDVQKTTAKTSKVLSNRTSDWTFVAFGIYGQMIAINQLENVVVVQWSTWDNSDPVELEKFPTDPYNEESVFLNAVIDALHDR